MKIIKPMSFEEILKEMEDRHKEAIEKLKKNGGMCLSCGKYQADNTSTLNPFNCSKCNEEAEKLIKELQKDSGFRRLQIK